MRRKPSSDHLLRSSGLNTRGTGLDVAQQWHGYLFHRNTLHCKSNYRSVTNDPFTNINYITIKYAAYRHPLHPWKGFWKCKPCKALCFYKEWVFCKTVDAVIITFLNTNDFFYLYIYIGYSVSCSRWHNTLYYNCKSIMYIYKYIIPINRTQIKDFVCIISACSVYIYYVYINTHSIHFEKIDMSVYIYIHIFYITQIYLIYKHKIFFLDIFMHVFVFIYTQ